MAAADILDRLSQSSIGLRVVRERLRAMPASRLTDELRAEIRAHKPELMRLLRPTRPIVEFRLESDPPNGWAVMLGAPGDTYEEAVAVLKRRLSNVAAVRPRQQ